MSTGTTKNKGQKDILDRFYTPFQEADRLISELSHLSFLNINNDTIFIEPSAGDGAFVAAVEKIFDENQIIALDISKNIYDYLHANNISY